MEGWNDCPLPMLAGGNGRARKRTSRATNLRRIIHANAAPTSENALGPGSAPPLPPANVNKEIVDSKLRAISEMIQLEGDEKELVEKLNKSLEALSAEELNFIDGILGSLLAKTPVADIEGQMDRYVKPGKESDWFVSLNSLVKAFKDHSS